MIGKAISGTIGLVVGFLMGVFYGSELGRIMWDALIEFIKGRISG